MNIFDPHITGSLSVSASAHIEGDLTVLGTIRGTAEINGEVDSAISASHAAEYLLTSSFEGVSGSFAITGSNTFKGDQTISGSLLPDGTLIHDIGSDSNRWRDIYLAGSTINLGGTKITKDDNGNVEFKDQNNVLKKIVTSEIQLGTGNNKKLLKVSNGKLKLFSEDESNEEDASFSGSFTGSFTGDGSNLTNVPASGVTGLSLDSISSGSNSLEMGRDVLVSNVSILPNITDTIDLGSPDKQWRDLFLSSGSLYINGQQVISTTGNELRITTDEGESIKIIETSSDTITLQTEDGDITLSSSGNGNIELDAPIQVGAGNKILSSDGNEIQFGNGLSITGSIVLSGTVDGVDVSGLKSNVDAILSGSQADKDSFAEIVTLINSVDTTNDEAFAAHYTSSNNRFVSLETTSGSQDGRITSLEATSGSNLLRISSLETTSGSHDDRLILLESFTGSVDGTMRGDFNTYTSSNDSTNTTQNGRLDSLETKTGSLSTDISNLSNRSDALEEFTSSVNDTYATDSDVTTLRGDLNTYTSSNDSTNTTQNNRLGSLETKTGSLDNTNTTQNNRLSSLETFTGSLDETFASDTDVTTLRDDLNTYTSSTDTSILIESLRINSIESFTASVDDTYATDTDVTTLRGELNTYTSSNNVSGGERDGRLDSLETKTGSLSTDITGLDGRLGSIETKTGSLDGRLGSIETKTGSLDGRLGSIETKTGSLDGRVSSIETKTGSLSTDISNLSNRSDALEEFTSSIDDTYATDTDVTNLTNRVGSLETKTGSLDSDNTTQNNRLNSLETTSGSQKTKLGEHRDRLDSIESFTGSIDDTYATDSDVTTLRGDLNTYTSSNDTEISNQDLRLVSLETESGSVRGDFNTYTSSNNSTNTTQNNRLGSLETTSGSHDGRLDSLETKTGSLSTDITGLDGRLDTIEGGLEFTGSNVTIKGDLLVKGTETRVDSTTVEIGDNIISLNGSGAQNAGIEVRDNTSPDLLSGSLIWDGETNFWKGGQKGSEERLLTTTDLSNIEDTSGSHDGRLDSIESKTGSFLTSTNLSSLEGKVDSLETTSGSHDGRIDSLEVESGSIRTTLNSYTSSNNQRGVERDERLGLLEEFTGSINDTYATDSDVTTLRGDLNSYTSSNDTTNTNQNNRLGSLETKTGSLDTTNTSQNNRLNSIETKTGSLDGRVDSLEEFTSSIDDTYATDANVTTLRGDLNSYTSSNDTTNTTQNNRLNSIETKTGSLDGDITNLRGDFNSHTSSNNTTNTTQNSRLTSLESETGSYSTTDYYTTGATFNNTNGIITGTRNDGGNWSVDIDGRYLTSFIETDPIFTASPSAGITETDITNWDTAYTYSTVGHLPLSGGTITGDVRFLDDDQLRLGNGNDLRLWHNGTNSYVFNYGGSMFIGTRTNDTTFLGHDGNNGDTTYFKIDGDNQGLYYYKSQFFADGIKSHYGASNDLEIYHDGSNSYITEKGSGDLIISADNDLTFKDGSGNVMANMNASNSVELMYGNSKKFETTNTGIEVTGDVNTTRIVTPTDTSLKLYPNGTGHLYLGDAGNGMNMYHYSQQNNGKYTTFTHSGTYYRISPGATSGLEITSNTRITGTLTASGYNDSNWNTAYGWGDHSQVGYITGFTNTNEFVTGATFNSVNGEITFTRNNGGDTFTVDLDGRYLTEITSHTHSANDITSGTLDNNRINWNVNSDFSGTYSLLWNASNSFYTADWLQVRGTDDTLLTRNIVADGNVTGDNLMISNWNTAYGWGDHSQEGYLTSYVDTYTTGTTWNGSTATLTFTRNDGNSYQIQMLETLSDVTVTGGTYNSGTQTLRLTKSDGDTVDVSGFAIDTDVNWYTTGATFNTGNGIITGTHQGGTWTVDLDGRYLTSFTETDPIFTASPSAGIAETDITNWDTAYGWGDHSQAGYLTSYNDEYTTGATFNSGNGVITFTRNDGDTYTVDVDGRYLTSFTETDTLDSVTSRGSSTSNRITVGGVNLNDGNSIIEEATGNAFRFKTGTGYIDIGSKNSGWIHFEGNRPYYFGTSSTVFDGDVRPYTNNVRSLGSASYRWSQIFANGGDSTQWNSAYGWGDHADGGYLTSYSETDTLSSVTSRDGTTTNDITVGDFYAVHQSDDNATTKGEMLSYSVAKFKPNSQNSGTLAIAQVDGGNSVGLQFTNGAGTANWDMSLQPFGGNVGINKVNPQGPLHVYSGTSERFLISGDVHVQGSTDLNINGTSRRLSFTSGTGTIRTTTENSLYLQTNSTTALTIDSSQNVSIVGTLSASGYNKTNWDTAYGWGDHADGGYLTSYTETDTLSDVVSRGNNFGNSQSGFVTNNTWGSEFRRIKRVTFTNGNATWDSDNHGIFSTDSNGTYSDSMSINSYNDVTLRVDANNNNDASYVRFSQHSTGAGTEWFRSGFDGGQYVNIFRQSGYVAFEGLDFAISNSNSNHGFNNFFRGDSSHLVIGTGGTLYLNYGQAAGTIRMYGNVYLNDTVILDSSRVLQNVTGNISMFTNDSNYLTEHPSVTAASSSNNSGRTYIQDILLDGNGHVTGVTTSTETVVNTNDIDYINSATFNTSTGVVTGTGVGNAGFTVDIDGRYLLDTSDTFTGSLTINGDIRGNGQQLVLNAGESYSYATGQTSEYIYLNAEQGLEINSHTGNWSGGWGTRKTALLRGDLLRLDGEDLTKTNIQNFKTAYGWGDHSQGGYLTSYNDEYVTGASWNSGTAVLTFTRNDGDTFNVNLLNTLSDVTVTGGTYNSGNQTLTLTKSDGGTVAVSGFAIDTDVNWYTTGATFNTSNGIITGTHQGGTWTVDLDGRYLTSESNSFLGDGGSANSHPGTNRVIFTGQVSQGSGALGMPTVDNSNSFLNINRHSGEYNSQLGFSSNGNIYYRSFSNTAINGTQAWLQVYHSGNFANNSGNWNTAYGWGDHSQEGYITSPDGGNAGLLDGIDSGQFLRSDVSDTHTATLTVNGQFIFNSSTNSDYREGIRLNQSTGGWGGGVFGGIRNSISGITDAWWVARNPSKDFVISYGTSSNSGGLHLPHNSSALSYKNNRIWNEGDFANNSSNWNTAYGWGDHSQGGYAVLSASNSFTNSYNEFGNGTGSVSNDGSWNARLNVAGTSHARLDVKSVSDGIITTMFSHTGNGAGKMGTMSNHPLKLMVGGTDRLTLDSSSNLTITGTMNSNTVTTNQVTAGKLNLASDSYEGSIVFGSSDTWHTGIRQHDDADAELRIWAKSNNGMIFLSTGYDGEPANISRPTDGLVVGPNNKVGIGNFSVNGNDPNAKLHVKGSTAGETIFNLEGTSGQLFSITDDLTGDLFSVSDASGVPIFNVNANGTVSIDSLGLLTVGGSITGNSFIKSGGTSSQFLKADGSVDSTTYVSTTGYNNSNWDTAYGWGDHASAGYIVQGSTQPDGGWTSATKFKSSGSIADADSGSHSLQIISDNNNDAFMAFHVSGDYAVFLGLDGGSNRLHTGGWSAGANQYMIWDSRDFSSTDITNWDTAYGWGDHSQGGYLTSFTETDPIFTASPSAGITDENIENWNTAHGWGDHASGGYLTSYSETDTLSSVIGRGNTTSGSISFTGTGANTGIKFNSTVVSNDGFGIRVNGTSNDGELEFYSTDDDTEPFVFRHYTVGQDGTGSSVEWFRIGAGGNISTPGTITASGYNKNSWDTAHGWGDHGAEGYATETYVGNAISDLVDSSPTTLDTLNELAAALGDDANFSTTVTNSIATKLPLSGGTLTGDIIGPGGRFRKSQSDNNYTTAALWTESYNTTTTGIAFHISGTVGKFLEMRTNGVLYWGNSEVLTDSIGLRSNQSDTMSGVLTINHTNDNQILLTSPSSWTGIGFNDSGASGTDYIWHNGTYNTFAIGGGGSSVSGKQLHIHGGTTIGSGFAGTSNPSNGLSVQGSIESGGTIGSNTSQTRDKLRVWNDGNYTIGFKNGFGFGHLGNSIGTATEYAMTFQTNNQSGRGWWWGTSSDNDNQGSMGLSNEGRANIKTSLSIGEGNTTAPSTTPLYVEGSTKGSTVFDVQGTQGQLFSITDDLTGDLFTVSDITGIPILTVNSLGTVTVDDTLHVTGDVIAYYASDRRLKENIKSISNPLDKIKLIGGYEFDWNQLSKNEGHDVGVIAQEIEEVLPELVGVRGDGYKGVKYEKLTALLIEAIKDQQSQIDDLKSKLNK